MTILARTSGHLVEFESGFLTIARYSDGHCVAHKAKGIAGMFRADLARFGAERAVATYLRLMHRAEWEPLYKPHRMPGVDAIRDAECDIIFPVHAP